MAAGTIIDEDSELALQHAVAARRLASRIAVVREAVGLAAYAAGDWTTAIAELRTYHRMTGRQTHLAELADCERALGRPERAIDLYRGADVAKLEKATAIELLIVAAGARGDLGQHDAAVAMLQVGDLTGNDSAEWAPRLRYAYADALLAASRRDEAREWFSRAAAVDEEQVTDAAERLLELDGVTIEGDEHDEDEDTDTDRDPSAEDDSDSASDHERETAENDADEDDDQDGDDLEDDGLEDDDLEDQDEDARDEITAVATTDVNTDGLATDADAAAVAPETFAEGTGTPAAAADDKPDVADAAAPVAGEPVATTGDSADDTVAPSEKAGEPEAKAEEKAEGDEFVGRADAEEKPKA
ncbi:Replicase polyprotein 1ab [Actinoplanes sp. G11-F43]|uniref:Replicase polyprotein 1ab n=1 Tax=Actinoplanes sp. G11-F43 TaxID=3424130 RepID=UPI003D33066F